MQRAFEYFTQAAEAGDATAQAFLGKVSELHVTAVNLKINQSFCVLMN